MARSAATPVSKAASKPAKQRTSRASPQRQETQTCRTAPKTPHVVAAVAFDGISPFHLSVPCVVFAEDRSDGGVLGFEFRVCSIDPGPLSTTAGFSIAATHGLDALADADTIIVPTWRDPDEAPPPALLDALRAAHARGAQLVGLCLGAYVLAAAGLLDGRPATTHWAWAADFARRFPDVKVDPQVLYVDDGDILTSAGTAAGLDCCLHVVRKLCGAQSANYIARRLVVPPHRQGGQAQYVQQPMPPDLRGDRLSALLDWVNGTLDAPHTLDSLAGRAAMSRRTFTRHFKAATGTTVSAWLLAQRLARAQQLLESTDESIESIAGMAGFGSTASLRQHFTDAFRTSPSAWRREFRGV
ncbi:transcriptional regulator, AraC family /transcriptional regulator, AraC family with amidase-like domain [Burkholderia sp. YR290]|jgi:transcriptional regulator GlxA family with amidase domain|uniref:AraC family transcriptional regulator n=1 Tax=Paraburkholderia hospita TaxID=169430 RepID=A0ABN0FNY1_9BURK|nr:helix-turn-helix domain-containing protein [Paraburkholderia hospita]EUC17045.1 DJ-1 domain, InhA-type [Burkholderia sp. BT03]SKC69679.1 transcriptional regulator, AraC family /transcriptional regulator, AraC family with amidase-like domain [Burkholderia sp. CF099]SOE56822.1 transcriptional regulator, AraC family /transcriptional regulator, AraC family with amidase-like domain [Burkholderia sp. YR290]EIN00516.1 AraC family transcriptional regulator [Paraburkholderia hospita]OUL84298.1 AraC 